MKKAMTILLTFIMVLQLIRFRLSQLKKLLLQKI